MYREDRHSSRALQRCGDLNFDGDFDFEFRSSSNASRHAVLTNRRIRRRLKRGYFCGDFDRFIPPILSLRTLMVSGANFLPPVSASKNSVPGGAVRYRLRWLRVASVWRRHGGYRPFGFIRRSKEGKALGYFLFMETQRIAIRDRRPIQTTSCRRPRLLGCHDRLAMMGGSDGRVSLRGQ
jgi:hypothetical protein